MPGRDVNGRPIAIVGAVIAASVALVVLAVFLLLHLWDMPARTDRVRLPYQFSIAGPSLQGAPQPDLARYRAEKQRLLDSSAWLDEAHGIARIPIATAMDLLVHPAAARTSAAASAPQVQR